jgi:putative ABC transport system substrate-binding protein
MMPLAGGADIARLRISPPNFAVEQTVGSRALAALLTAGVRRTEGDRQSSSRETICGVNGMVMSILRLAVALMLLAAPFAAEAQTGAKVFRIGILSYLPATDPLGARFRDVMLDGLRELGYVERQNIVIEWRSWQGNSELLRALATELARLKPDVIIVGPTPAAEEMKRASSAIPIVAIHGDPVGSGLVTSLAKPGGNVTGISVVNPELVGKQLQLLTEAIPRLSRVAVLSNPNTSTHRVYLREAEVAARFLKLQLLILQARDPAEFADAFLAARNERAGALVVLGDSMFFVEGTRLAELAAKGRLPSIAPQRELAAAGYLMAYGVNVFDAYRRTATYVDKILKGAKPADLPVEQATKFELVVNLKTAKTLGLTIPPPVLLRAAEVIQ